MPASDRNNASRAADSGLGRTVLDDLRRTDLSRSVWRDLQDLYLFYLDDEQREQLGEMSRLRRGIATFRWVLVRLILALAPARRLLLLLAFALVGWGLLDARFSGVSLGFLTLVLVLMFELRDKLLARDELEVGRAVQLALLPEGNPQLPGWDIWLHSEPANDVGGDLVDYLALGDGRLGLTLGDVAGKALAAALLAAKLQATLRAFATETDSLVDLAGRTNRIFHRDGLPNRFATLIYADLRSDEGTVRLVNAGHMPPLAVLSGRLCTLPPVALPLGIQADAEYREQRIETAAGDLIVLYSDGVSEAADQHGNMLGEDRLRALVGTLGGLSAEAAGRKVLACVGAFIGETRPNDDLSIAILRRVD